MNRYDIVDQVGKGTYSTVYKAIDKSMRSINVASGTQLSYVAIKISHEKSIDLEDYNKEINVLRSLNHPNIIRYIDSFKIENNDITSKSANQQNPDQNLSNCKVANNSYCIVTEYVDGIDLLNYLNINGPFQESHAKKIMAEILSAVFYMHSKKVMHRDLKLENIMITKDFHVKIIDFGFSCQSENQDTMRTTLCASVA